MPDRVPVVASTVTPAGWPLTVHLKVTAGESWVSVALGVTGVMAW